MATIINFPSMISSDAPSAFASYYSFACIVDAVASASISADIFLFVDGPRTFTIYVDDVLLETFTLDCAAASYGYFLYAIAVSTIPVGSHTLKVVSDDYTADYYCPNITFEVDQLGDYIDTIVDMTYVAAITDDSTYMFGVATGTFAFYYKNVILTNLYISGNSFMGFNSAAAIIDVNYRDGKMYNYYYQYLGNGLKVRWEGYSVYSNTSEIYRVVWEIFFLDNGDVMINIVNASESSWNGVFGLFGTPFIADGAAHKLISFYRQNTEGTSWTVAYEVYNGAKSLNLF